MLQKTTIVHIIRRSILVICAVFCFAGLFACSEDNSSLPAISDVFAPDVSVVYDGRSHSISVANTLPSDTVTYSTDNVVFSSSCPAFSSVGSYTVYFKVIRSGYTEFSSSATVSISPCILSDISAPDLSFVYDGLAHSPSISGTLSSDSISYSTDGVSFSSDVPYFTDVGVYTVYYRVQRPYGDYKSSCSITILPNIYGRYFNPNYGIIVISSDISFSVSGSGFIDSIPFSVTDNVLTYNSVNYYLLSSEDCIYRLNSSIYFIAPASGSLSITFEDDVALVMLEDNLLLSVPDFNYCESGVIADYSSLSFTQAFSSSSSSVITDIYVELSLRDFNPITIDTLFFTYDGLPHEFDFSDDVIYIDEDNASFTDVGSYTLSVVFTSSVYLPKLLDCTLVILPDVSGIFVSSEHVIQISGESVYLDGMPCGELSIVSDAWAWNDLPITVTADGIVCGNTAYTLVSSTVLVVYVDDVYSSYLLIPSDILFIRASYDNAVLSFTTNDNTLLLSIPLSCNGISLALNNRTLAPFDSAYSFILGLSDFSSAVSVVHVSTEK